MPRGPILPTVIVGAGVAIGSACGVLAPAGQTSRSPAPTFLLGGIQVNEPDHAQWTRTLTDVGMNTVAVTIYARQADWDGDNLWYDEEAEWVVREIRSAKRAGLHVVLILRVALDHAYERNRFLWHGMIMPRTPALLRAWFRRYRGFAHKWARVAEAEGVDVLGVASELNALTSTMPVDSLPGLLHYYLDDEQQRNYRDAVLSQEDRIDTRYLRGDWGETYDSLPRYVGDRAGAERAWAEATSLGGNVNALNARRVLLKRLWVELIGELRGIYTGPLTYAANFDQYHEVSFWRELDYIGINAYFPLRARPTDARDAAELYPVLEGAWRDILGGIADFRRREQVTDRPVLFTELGYTFRVNSTIEPWAADGFSLLGGADAPDLMLWEERGVDYQERALAVRALRHAATEVQAEDAASATDPDDRHTLLGGILYWKLSTLKEHEQIEPFVLILGPDPPDPLLAELLGFL